MGLKIAHTKDREIFIHQLLFPLADGSSESKEHFHLPCGYMNLKGSTDRDGDFPRGDFTGKI